MDDHLQKQTEVSLRISRSLFSVYKKAVIFQSHVLTRVFQKKKHNLIISNDFENYNFFI